MDNSFIFPYDYVKQHSKIIIHGYGNLGQSYVSQLEKSKWADIVCIVDNANGLFVQKKIYPITEVANRNYDYLVIAIQNKETAKRVADTYIQQGIPSEKIIYNSWMDSNEQEQKNQNIENDMGYLNVAIILIGGMGDFIVYRRLYQQLIKFAPECKVTLIGNVSYIEAVYGKEANVKAILPYTSIPDNWYEFSVVMSLAHWIDVYWFNRANTAKYSVTLANKIDQIVKDRNYAVNVSVPQYADAIFIQRAVYQGANRYQALGHQGIFNLSSEKARIPMLPEYENQKSQLGLKNYITFNYGADDVLKDGNRQTKVWPSEHYEQLIQLLKERFPTIQVVQLGTATSEQIHGADYYLLGDSLELVKWVLKDAILHIDCEGGLVHLATQLETKCAVLFGPTSREYYGYDENINIVSAKCNGCMGLIKDWYVRCCRGLQKPECMYSIVPDDVLRYIEEYIKEVLEERHE